MSDVQTQSVEVEVENASASIPPVQRLAQSAPDPFDPASLRLSQDYAASIGVKKVLTTVRCRKPNSHEFIRVRPGDDWHLETGIFEDKITKDIYLVSPAFWPELYDEVSPVCLFTAINRQEETFLWHCKLPGADGRTNSCNESAMAAARLAESSWVRVKSNMPAGMYDVFQAAAELSEPTWPDLSLNELLRLCFRDRFINSPDHPVILALRGVE